MAKRIVELKDKATSFHDFETGFDIARSQQKELKAPVGKATRQALQSGRLVDVREDEPEKKADAK